MDVSKVNAAKNANNANAASLRNDAQTEVDPNRKQKMLTCAQQCEEAAAACVQVLVDDV